MELTDFVKQEKIDATLAFLNDFKKACDDKTLISAGAIAANHKLSALVVNAAKELGYFKTVDKYYMPVCTKNNFEPIDARKTYLLSREIWKNSYKRENNTNEAEKDIVSKCNEIKKNTTLPKLRIEERKETKQIIPNILDNFSTEELIDEIKKRGGSGEINFITKFTL